MGEAAKTRAFIDEAGTGVIPPIPYVPIPADLARKFPALEQWNKQNHAALETWRKKAVVVTSPNIG